MKIEGHNRGFTLIELLVVIAIIGILSSVVLATLNSTREKARDARRASDMKQIQNALELYYADNQQYPDNPSSTRVVNMNTGSHDITPYIDPIPADPTQTGSSGYRYRQSNVDGRQSYTLLVKLEKNSNAWCSLGIPPGYSTWEGNYDDCEF